MGQEERRCPNCHSSRLRQIGDIKCKCEACGTEIFLNTEQTNSILNDANRLRNENKFDEAQEKIEQFLSIYNPTAEAYYQLTLVRLGIAFVDEYKDGNYKPTLSRLSKDSVFEMEEAKKCLSLAGPEEKTFYDGMLKKIEQLRSKVYEKSRKQEKFDVFISFKQRPFDNPNALTKDCDVAQEIYDHLIRQGYKVFFSKKTLQSMAGEEYEPVIYQALTSSKVMLVIWATPNQDYLNAPWVKNEWARFLNLVKEDDNRIIIPILANGCEPERLPIQLAKKQCLNFDASFWGNLDRIVDSKLNEGISNIFHKTKVQAQEVSKKTVVKVNTQKRQLTGQTVTITADILSQIRYIESKIEQSDWKGVKNQLHFYLKQEQYAHSGEFNWLKVKYLLECCSDDDLDKTRLTKKQYKNQNEILEALKWSFEGNDISGEIIEDRLKHIIELLIYNFSNSEKERGLSNEKFNILEQLYNFISYYIEDGSEYDFACRVSDRFQSGILSQITKLNDIQRLYDKMLYPALTHGTTDQLIDFYLGIADYAQYPLGNYEVAEYLYKKVLDLYEIEPNAILGTLICKFKTSDCNVIIKNSNIVNIVNDALVKTLSSGSYHIPTYTDSDDIFGFTFKLINAALQNHNGKLAYQLFNTVYQYLPSEGKYKRFSQNALKEYAANFIQYEAFEEANKLCIEFIANDSNCFEVFWYQFLATHKFQNPYEFIASSFNFDKKNNIEIQQTLSTVATHDTEVDADIFFKILQCQNTIKQDKLQKKIVSLCAKQMRKEHNGLKTFDQFVKTSYTNENTIECSYKEGYLQISSVYAEKNNKSSNSSRTKSSGSKAVHVGNNVTRVILHTFVTAALAFLSFRFVGSWNIMLFDPSVESNGCAVCEQCIMCDCDAMCEGLCDSDCFDACDVACTEVCFDCNFDAACETCDAYCESNSGRNGIVELLKFIGAILFTATVLICGNLLLTIFTNKDDEFDYRLWANPIDFFDEGDPEDIPIVLSQLVFAIVSVISLFLSHYLGIFSYILIGIAFGISNGFNMYYAKDETTADNVIASIVGGILLTAVLIFI